MGAAPSSEPPVDVDYSKEPCFLNADGLHVFTRCWEATSLPVRGLVFISHGLGEHSGRPGYDTLAKQLATLGVTVIAHDHVGHGRSQGMRSDIKDFALYVRDVVQHIEEKQKDLPNVPIIIIGHSMGGTVALLTALEHPDLVRGVILSAPGLESFPSQAGIMARYFLPLLARNAPYMVVAGPSSDTNLTRDEEQLAILRADPFYHARGTKARWAHSYLKALEAVQKSMASVEVPFLILHGTEDRLTNIEGSVHLNEQAMSQDKTLKILQGAVHSLLHEVKQHQQETLLAMSDWVETRLRQWQGEEDTRQSESIPPDPSAAVANLDAVLAASEEKTEEIVEVTTTESGSDSQPLV